MCGLTVVTDEAVQLFKPENGEELFSTLAAHVAQPGWSFDGVGTAD